MFDRLPRSLLSMIGILAIAWSLIWQAPLATAAPALTISPITWNVLGLDSNKVTSGPDTFMVGARVCNTGTSDATNVISNFIWDTTNTYINLSGASSLSVAALAASACTDFYYNIAVTRNSAAYDTTRRYHITVAADTLGTISTPTPRELYVEHLVSQNRNAVTGVSGPTSVVVGQTYQYVVNGSTATGGYEQLEAFLNFPNVMFQLISVASTYTSPTGGSNDKTYADACGWDNDPTHVAPSATKTYRSCIGPTQYSGGKAGGTIVTTYNVKILSAGTATLTTLIYDFSGSSYHYNADLGIGVNSISVTASAASPPVAADDSITTTGTTPATLTPASNDTATGGTTLVPGSIDLDPATAGQQTSRTTVQGNWVLNTTTGQVTFTPVAGFTGTASIPYTIPNDAGLTSNQANLSVTVSAPSAPIAANDSTTTTGTTPATLTPPANDTAGGNGATLVPGSIDLDPATASQQTSRTTVQGSWVLNTTTGQVTFTPAAGLTGAASIPYTIKDNYGTASNQATLTVTVGAPAAPAATNDSTTTTGTTPATLTPATNDTPGAGATLVPSTIDLDPATAGQQTSRTTVQGSWVLNTTTGQVTFTPAAGFVGIATIPYTIQDSYGQTSNLALLSVTVSAPAAPIAANDSTTTTGTMPATLTPPANDTAGGNGATLVPSTIDLDPTTAGQQTTLTVPGKGIWALDTTTGQVTFLPDTGFIGTSTIPYIIRDNYRTPSNQATLSVTVGPPAAPIAANDSTTTTGTNSVTLVPAGNDTAGTDATLVPGTIDLDPATAGQQATLAVPGEGTWVLDPATGLVTFTPVLGFTGTSTIPYTIEDNYGQLSNQANLAVTVSAPPPAPTANPDSTTTIGTTAALLDPVTNDEAGAVGITLVPGTIDLDPATPSQQTTLTVPGEGTWALDTSTGKVTFTPVSGFTGTSSIPYTIQDSLNQTSNQAALSVAVSVPAAPTATDDSTTTTGTTPATLAPATTDTAGGNGATLVVGSIDLDPVTAGQQTSLTTVQGNWVLNTTTGQVTFTPAAGYTGTSSIPYSIDDSLGQTSNVAILSVTVNKPTAPIAANDSATTTGTTPATLTPKTNDTAGGNGATLVPSTIDLDPATAGQQTTMMVAGQGTWALDTTTGLVTFIPVSGFTGTANLPYTINDNYGTTSNQATLSVIVGVPAAPIAAADSTTTTGTTPATLAPSSNDTAGGSGVVLVPSTIDLDPATAGQQTTLTVAGQGIWSLNTATGTVTFTPVAGYAGTAIIPYTISDSVGQTSNQANLSVVVSAPTAPIATDDSTTTTGTTPATLAPATNDTAGGNGATLVPSTIDLDPATAGQQITLSVAGEGIWNLNATTGQVTFIPVAGFIGTASIPYTIQDNYGTTSNQANLSVVVSAPATPVAADDSTTTTGTNPVNLIPVANDTPGGNGATLVPSTIDLDPATAGQQTTLTVAGQGTWALDTTNGEVTFTPAGGFIGTAITPYMIQDNYGTTSNQANLSVVVSAPVGLTANPDSTTTIGTTPVTLTPASNDATGGSGSTLVPSTLDLDPATAGQQTTLTVAGQGAWTFDTTTGTVTFTPVAGYTGTASIPYTIQDNYGTTSNQANLSVVVSAPAAPTATDDSTTTSATGPVTLTPITNDAAGGNGAVLLPGTIDLDPATPGQQTTITTIQGLWTLNPSTGEVTYTPAPGFSGTATLPYTVQNNYGITSPAAVLSVMVTGPTAVALVSFNTAWQHGALVVRWVTAAEINTWGFHLYRSATRSRADAIQVTPTVILAKGHNQGGGSYEWTDAGATAGQTYSYWLQEIELNSSTHEYGPATTGTAASLHTLYLPLVIR